MNLYELYDLTKTGVTYNLIYLLIRLNSCAYLCIMAHTWLGSLNNKHRLR